MVEVKVQVVLFDVNSNAPVIILRDASGKKILPIWVGHFEANAIEIELEGIKPPRPLTHDLFIDLLRTIGAEVKKVSVCDLQINTFYAIITIAMNKKIVEIDARPSDAIAIAMRSKAPIYAAEWILKEASLLDTSDTENEEEKFKKFLESIKPEDFKYKH